MKENLYTKVARRSHEVQEEAIEVAEQLVEVLKKARSRPMWGGEGNWAAFVERWESMETVLAALQLCIAIALDDNPLRLQNLSRQLRRWRRLQGKGERGWLEVRKVKGSGPYVYYRYRLTGERKIRTEYYGRADLALGYLVDLPAVEDRPDHGE